MVAKADCFSGVGPKFSLVEFKVLNKLKKKRKSNSLNLIMVIIVN